MMTHDMSGMSDQEFGAYLDTCPTEPILPLSAIVSHAFHYHDSGCASWRHGLRRVCVPASQDEHGVVHVTASIAKALKQIV
jgi:hypothetical protein